MAQIRNLRFLNGTFTLYPLLQREWAVKKLAQGESLARNVYQKSRIRYGDAHASSLRVGQILVEALKNAKGNMAKTARVLGTTTRILSYRIQKLNIDPKQFKK